MSEPMRVDFNIFYGPNLLVPFAAVVTEISGPFRSRPAPEHLEHMLNEGLPVELTARIQHPIGNFEHLVAAITVAIQDQRGPTDLRNSVHSSATSSRIAFEFNDAQATSLALRLGLELATAVYANADNRAVQAQALADIFNSLGPAAWSQQPDYIAHALIRNARSRGIPVYPVASGSRIWQYGQGHAGFQFFEAANDLDSLTGFRLSSDKFTSNQLVTRLGLPGVVHGIASSPQAALQLARQFGFPLVVKPINRGKGLGVTAGVMTDAELADAFEKANPHSPGRVLVERHVPGDDHRLTVLGGKLAWCARRSPPRVIGDGRQSITELIAKENESRSKADVAAGFMIRLNLDEDMQKMLARQGYTADTCPAQGVVVQLRSIANTATGGKITDCTEDMHPDNRNMAEAIARGFRLDAVGIDFMTTDIKKSWREIDCAVIEVNSTPGIAVDSRAEVIMRSKFPEGTTGRIPGIVLVGCNAQVQAGVAAAIQTRGRCIGQTDNAATLIGGQPRFSAPAALPARVMALLLDPTCEILVINVTPDEIARHGFPLDHCELALIADLLTLSAPMRQLIWQCVDKVIDGVTAANVGREAIPAALDISGKDTSNPQG